MLLIDAARASSELCSVNFNYIYLYCAYVCIHIWGSEDNLWEFFYLLPTTWFPGIELTPKTW